jgi:hypothetical protein
MADEIVDTVDRQISELTRDDEDTSTICPKYIYSLFTKTGTPLYTAPEI